MGCAEDWNGCGEGWTALLVGASVAVGANVSVGTDVGGREVGCKAAETGVWVGWAVGGWDGSSIRVGKAGAALSPPAPPNPSMTMKPTDTNPRAAHWRALLGHLNMPFIQWGLTEANPLEGDRELTFRR